MLANCRNGIAIAQIQCCGAGAAWIRHFRVEPEPIFLLAGAAFFKAAPAASFWQAEKESLVFVTKHDLKAVYTVTVNVIQKILA